MKKEEIIQKVKELDLPEGEYAVFGSGPMIAHRLREGHDIDLIVSEKVYQQLKDAGWKEKPWPSGEAYLAKDVFEAGTGWDYGSYQPDVQKLIEEAEIIEGVPFVQLEEVRKWKEVFGRKKDLQDLKLIENYLNKNMAYKGVIIGESLEDESVLDEVRILETRVEEVTEEHQTPRLRHWTLYTVEVLEDKGQEVAEKISKALDVSRGHWYADFKNEQFHYVVFENKVFKVDRSKKEEYEEATQYGISLGIPDYQLDFSPEIK